MQLLHNIRSHEDLTCLNDEQRQQLCREIRDFLVSQVALTGGHLASNLGVVELTVALETVFDTASDRLVFDVGHQSYVHKLLTGRQADFAGLRQFGGMAGFPKPGESDTDAFVAGHASSSVSIALGMARARTLQNKDYSVVALLGDGAATGGMVYEGLNDAAESKEPLIVILNDNAMSIDRNVGGMASHLAKLRTKEGYLGMKRWFRVFTGKFRGGKRLYRVLRASKNWLRRVLIPTTIFENMGFDYLGPVDGHDVNNLVSVLRSARELRYPVVVHVITQKGKGYEHSEKDPCKFHGVGKFDPSTGDTGSSSSNSFSAAFGAQLCRLAREDNRVCAITAAMPGGTGLLDFKEQFPNRLFDVGIAEEHAVSMAGGLAKQGMIPVVALYSTFLQRAYDQILQDVGLLNLHVVFAIDRAGLVGEDGETHHGMFDTGFMRHVPGMRILCPASTAELQEMLRWAVLEYDGPVAIRYPRGGDGSYKGSAWDENAPVIGHRRGNDCAIVTYGTMVNHALHAGDLLQSKGVHASVIRLSQIHPLPVSALEAALSGYRHIAVLEDSHSCAGIFESVASAMHEIAPACSLIRFDLGDRYATHGSVASLLKHYGLDGEAVASRILEVISNEN